MSAAAEMWARECRYERLHHELRLHELSQIERPDWHQRELLRLTRAFLANPLGGSGGRFDLSDTARVAELDEFEKTLSAERLAA